MGKTVLQPSKIFPIRWVPCKHYVEQWKVHRNITSIEKISICISVLWKISFLAPGDLNEILDDVIFNLIVFIIKNAQTLQWPHNYSDGISNHQHLDCLFNHLFWRRSKITSKLRINGLCEGNPPVTSGFLSQMASNAENVPIWWCHPGLPDITRTTPDN